MDEALKLAPRVQVTPELQRLMVEMGSQMPFEAADRLLHELMPMAPARSTLVRQSSHPKAAEVATYLANQHEGLLDYRRREGFADLDLRGLGATEGNIDKVLATQMGKRGMAWTPAGARRMGKVLEASRNDELERHLTAVRREDRGAEQAAIKPLRRKTANAIASTDSNAWLQASIATLPTSEGFGVRCSAGSPGRPPSASTNPPADHPYPGTCPSLPTKVRQSRSAAGRRGSCPPPTRPGPSLASGPASGPPRPALSAPACLRTALPARAAQAPRQILFLRVEPSQAADRLGRWRALLARLLLVLQAMGAQLFNVALQVGHLG